MGGLHRVEHYRIHTFPGKCYRFSCVSGIISTKYCRRLEMFFFFENKSEELENMILTC